MILNDSRKWGFALDWMLPGSGGGPVIGYLTKSYSNGKYALLFRHLYFMRKSYSGDLSLNPTSDVFSYVILKRLLN